MAAISQKEIRMTITVLASLPIFALYPFMQKYFSKGIVFHSLFQHFNRWRCVYTGRLSGSMSQYSGYKFKFNSILIQSTSPGSSEHMWIQLLRKSRMIRSYFSAYLFSILSTFPVDIADRFPLITV